MNLQSQDTQLLESNPLSQAGLSSDQTNPLSSDEVDLTLLSMENDFDLNYLQWVNSLERTEV